MSCYETHKGILKKVDTDNVRWYLFDLTNDNEILNEDCIITDFMYDNNLENKYIIIKNGLYEWLDHKCKFDEEDDFCDLKENQDKTISIHAQFYNGGKCLDEVFNDNWDKLTENKELSVEQLINVACKWLDYHHSDYIVHLEYGALVAGKCQTDLRAFLNKVKNLDYYEALNLAKECNK